ncbi:MAG TPA: alpha/beta hydrolase fold domain-containing protein, partial [Kineosporiaceae bacterium]
MARTTVVRVIALTAIGSGACTASVLPAYALPLTPYQRALFATAAAPAAAQAPGWGGVHHVTGTSATTTTHTSPARQPAAAPRATPAVPPLTVVPVAPPTLALPAPPAGPAPTLAVAPHATPTAVASTPAPAAPVAPGASQTSSQATAPAATVAVPPITITVTIAPQAGTWTVARQQPPVPAQPAASRSDEQPSPAPQSHSPENRHGAPSGEASPTPEPASPTSPWFTPTAPRPSTPVPSATRSPVPFHGWSSGASGNDVATGGFGSWRGSAATMAGTWDDGDAATQTNLPTVAGEFTAWDGDLDVAVGGTVPGSDESYAAAARGAYLDRWTTMARNLQTLRGDKAGTTFVRPFHDFNGDWTPNWQVTPDNLADYTAAFRLIAQTIRQNCPRCTIVWSPNNRTSSGSASPVDAYPGDDVVDVIGVDSFNANGNTVVTDARTWEQYAGASSNGVPVGPEAWRRFAESHGKPIAFPEWGLASGGGGGDDPAYIQGMHDWMAQHAAQPGDTNLAGKVVYDVYFNLAMGGNNGFLIKDGPNTQSAQTYTRLHWGTAPGSSATTVATDTATPQQTQPQQTQPRQTQVQGPAQQTQVQDLRVGPVGVTADAQTVKDLAYASASPAQVLDLYLPTRTGAAVPLVIDIHGGAFSSGDKADSGVLFNLQALLAQGYAVASVNYRLSGEAPFPAGVQDVKAAVRYLRAHAAEYGLDPTRFAAWGTSAGGYLAAMIGATGGQTNAVLDDAALGNSGLSSTVQAVVSMYGPSDFTTIDAQLKQACGANASRDSGGTSPESQWLGAPVSSSPNARGSVIPAWVVSAPAGSLPPFLLAHGDADCTVPVGQSTELADALRRARTTVQLQVVPGAEHSDQAIDQGLLG